MPAQGNHSAFGFLRGHDLIGLGDASFKDFERNAPHKPFTIRFRDDSDAFVFTHELDDCRNMRSDGHNTRSFKRESHPTPATPSPLGSKAEGSRCARKCTDGKCERLSVASKSLEFCGFFRVNHVGTLGQSSVGGMA